MGLQQAGLLDSRMPAKSALCPPQDGATYLKEPQQLNLIIFLFLGKSGDSVSCGQPLLPRGSNPQQAPRDWGVTFSPPEDGNQEA